MSVSSVSSGNSPQAQLLSLLKSSGLSSDLSGTIGSEIDSVIKSTLSSSSSSSSGKASPGDVRSAIEQKLQEDLASGEITDEQAKTIRSALNQFEAQMKGNRSKSGSSSDTGDKGGPPDASELADTLDTNGDGTISKEEFLAGKPKDMTDEQASQMWESISNGADSLSKDAFVSGMEANTPSGPPPGGGGGSADPSGSTGSGSSTKTVESTETTTTDGVTTTVTTYTDGTTSTSVTDTGSDNSDSSSDSSSTAASASDAIAQLVKALSGNSSDTGTTDYLKKLLGGGLIDTSA